VIVDQEHASETGWRSNCFSWQHEPA
jgi:hypothetical protein